MTSGQYENNLTKHNVSLPVITHCTDILWHCPVDILRGTTKKTMHIWCTPSLSNTKTHKIYGHTVCFGLNKDKGTLCFAVLKPLKTQNYTHRDQRAYKQKITKHIRILTLTHTHWIGWQGVERTARREGCRQCDGWGDRQRTAGRVEVYQYFGIV